MGIENIVYKGENFEKAHKRVKDLENNGYLKKVRYYVAGGTRQGNRVILRSPGSGEYLVEVIIFHNTKTVEMTVYAAEHLLQFFSKKS